MEIKNNKGTKEIVSIPTTDGKAVLQGEICYGTDNEDNPFYLIGVVVTHPMPLLGGNMWNNVVDAVCNAFQKQGATTLRFNFRGAGGSTGSRSWQGESERTDVLSCCQFFLGKSPQVKKIILIGYSYGSVISSSIASERDDIIGYVAISYPFGPLSLMLLGWLLPKAKIEKPKFFVIGDKDNFTSKSTFLSRYNDFPGIKDYFVVPGADHFWIGNEYLFVGPILNWANQLISGNLTK